MTHSHDEGPTKKMRKKPRGALGPWRTETTVEVCSLEALEVPRRLQPTRKLCSSGAMPELCKTCRGCWWRDSCGSLSCCRGWRSCYCCRCCSWQETVAVSEAAASLGWGKCFKVPGHVVQRRRGNSDMCPTTVIFIIQPSGLSTKAEMLQYHNVFHIVFL